MAEVINFSNLPKWRRMLKYCSFTEKIRVIFKAANEWLWDRWVGIIPDHRCHWTTLIEIAAEDVLYPVLTCIRAYTENCPPDVEYDCPKNCPSYKRIK